MAKSPAGAQPVPAPAPQGPPIYGPVTTAPAVLDPGPPRWLKPPAELSDQQVVIWMLGRDGRWAALPDKGVQVGRNSVWIFPHVGYGAFVHTTSPLVVEVSAWQTHAYNPISECFQGHGTAQTSTQMLAAAARTSPDPNLDTTPFEIALVKFLGKRM